MANDGNDIWSALNQTYIKSATAEQKEQKDTITHGYKNIYADDLNTIKEFAKDQKSKFKEIAKEEAKLHQLSLQYKRDIYEQESQHYNNIYNLKTGMYEKEVSFLEKERDIRKKIADTGKTTVGDLAELYTIEKEREKERRKSIDAQQEHFKKRVENVKKGISTVFEHIFKLINNIDDLNVWNNWSKGLKDLGAAYEERFTEIAARNGSGTQMQTHSMLKGALTTITNDSILSKGLNFNNEVFPAITEAVQKGFIGQEATDIAIENAIDKKIAPWLDTSSETWVNLQYQLSDDMLAQLKGQQMLLQETREGNRILQNGVVSALMDELAPTLLNIDANTTDVTDLSGQAQQMVASLMANGYSKQDAVKVANQTIDAYQNPFQNLSGNSTTWQKMLAIGGLQGGDLASAMDFATGAISPFNNGTWQAGGAVAMNLGVPTNGFTRNTNYIQDLIDAATAANGYAGGNLSGVYTSRLNNLNAYTTATQQNDNKYQNSIAETAFDSNLTRHGIEIQSLIFDEVHQLKTWLFTTAGVLIGGYIADKVTDGFIKKVLTKFTGGGSTSSGGGILKNLTAGGKGSSKITQAMNSKLSGAALVAGGALVAKEGIDVISESNDILNDKTSNNIEIEKANKNKVAGRVAIAGGTVAAGAGIASLVGAGAAAGPIGWAALAIGGLALGAKALNDHFAALDDASAHITQSFNESKQKIEDEAHAREDQLFAIQNNITSLETTDEKLEYLQKNGINTTLISKQLEGKTTDEVNKQLQIYLDNLITQNSQDAEDAQTLIDDISADFKNQFNDNVDDVKDAILQNYSSEALKAKGFSGDDIWKEQKKALSKLGYTDSELTSLSNHWKNGAADKGELEDFLDSGAVQGDNIGSFEDHVEDGKVDASKVNYVLRQAGVNNIELQDAETISRILGTLATDIIYLHNNQKYGRETDKVTTGLPIDFTQEKYDTAKANILAARSDSKNILDMAFKNLGHSDAMSDWPNSLKGFKLGSTYIPSDMLAILHAGERVLTAGQNKEYTKELTSGNSTSDIIQAGVQDIVIAIKSQTNEIINYLSTMSFNNSSFNNSQLNMLPSMGNTKVTV